jgi:hypothetical protein
MAPPLAWRPWRRRPSIDIGTSHTQWPFNGQQRPCMAIETGTKTSTAFEISDLNSMVTANLKTRPLVERGGWLNWSGWQRRSWRLMSLERGTHLASATSQSSSFLTSTGDGSASGRDGWSCPMCRKTILATAFVIGEQPASTPPASMPPNSLGWRALALECQQILERLR